MTDGQLRKKILITGATGYIGRRLKTSLLKKPALSLRLLVRNRNKVNPQVRQEVEIVEGDTFQQQALAQAVAGIDTAYYLIHSMGAGADFERLDRMSAKNFRDACIAAGVKRIVYLGGLGVKKTASKHLLSRIETGEILSARPEQIQTIWVRAGVIIGSGSASFEIIRNLVQKLPVMLTPRGVATQTQPIAVADVLSYLTACHDLDYQGNLMVDIGCGRMKFGDMLVEAAKAMGLKRFIIPVPVLTPRLSAYWLLLLTPVPFRVAAALAEGLKSETVMQNDHAARYFPHIRPLPYREAVLQAITDIEQNQVISRWCDSSGGATCDINDQEDIAQAVLRDQRIYDFGDIAPDKIYTTLCSIGGDAGWFTYNFLWRLRGFIDKMFGGYGLNRGRRDPADLRVGDALDFWKVVDMKPNKRLLLLAQMKLPGKAWLEFDIKGRSLIQTAHFYPRGIWGRLYWYSVLPLHSLIFRDLIKKIASKSEKKGSTKRQD
jgi:uncharacterized protein YbjT (DUF2867 family)